MAAWLGAIPAVLVGGVEHPAGGADLDACLPARSTSTDSCEERLNLPSRPTTRTDDARDMASAQALC
jgi:hypothetical protein